MGRMTCVGTGMPEELAIAKAALARSFDVLALTPKEKTYRCWDTEWPDQSEDVPRVRGRHSCLSFLATFPCGFTSLSLLLAGSSTH